MVIVHRTENFISHSGTKGMKWGYNDGQRNGKRTAAELKKVAEEKAKLDGKSSADFEGDYHEANNMLKYLGITLDLQSDDVAVARTMAIYEEMRDSKDKYKTQYDWLNAFSNKLAGVGYDMAAVDQYLLQNKEKLNEIAVGSGSGNREKSNQDWADNDSSKSKQNTKTKKKSTEGEAKTESNNVESNLAKETREHKEKRKGVKHSAMMNDLPGEYLEMHGTKGMHWGTRLYQNPDGSLTPLGRARYGSSQNYENAKKYKVQRDKNKVIARNQKINDKLKKKYGIDQDKDEAKKDSKSQTPINSSTKKKAKDMTDDELRQRINRLKLEDDYNTWNKKVNPEVKSKGQKFREGFNSVATDVLKNSAKAAGTALLTQWLKDKGSDAFGIDLNGGKAKEVKDTVKKTMDPVKTKLDKKVAKAEKKAKIKESKDRIKDSKEQLKANRAIREEEAKTARANEEAARAKAKLQAERDNAKAAAEAEKRRVKAEAEQVRKYSSTTSKSSKSNLERFSGGEVSKEEYEEMLRKKRAYNTNTPTYSIVRR